MRALLLLVLLSGCDPRFKCSNNSQCFGGQVCMRFEPSPEDVSSRCVTACTSSADCDGGVCFCPDSPAGARCTIAGSSRVTGNFYCGP